MLQRPETVAVITYAACCLHNLLIQERPGQYLEDVAQQCNPGAEPVQWHERETLAHLHAVGRNRNTRIAKGVREHLCGYVNAVGAVPWQQEMVDRVSNFKMCYFHFIYKYCNIKFLDYNFTYLPCLSGGPCCHVHFQLWERLYRSIVVDAS